MNNLFSKPLDIDILKSSDLSTLKEVTSIDIFDQNSSNFHPEGLFSTQIFGDVGSDERLLQFGYINFKLKVFNPIIYHVITRLSSFYKSIIHGDKRASFNTDINDFVPDVNGSTGISFFIKHFDKIKFKKTASIERTEYIKLLTKYNKSDILIDKLVIIPAGLRDYTITESGKALESEINEYYRKLISVSKFSSKFNEENISNSDLEAIDSVKLRIQKIVYDIYLYLFNIINDKHGFIQDKWTQRNIVYGTRSVITASSLKIDNIEDSEFYGYNKTVVGLIQYVKGITPITIHNMRTKYISNIISPTSNMSELINKKTLIREPVKLPNKLLTDWGSDIGLEDIINKCRSEDVMLSDIEIENHYLYLIYDDGKRVVILNNIDDLDSTYDTKYIRPMKYIDLLYLSVKDVVNKYPCLITRYPVTGYGSIYPSEISLKPTNQIRRVEFIDLNSIRKETNVIYPMIDLESSLIANKKEMDLDRLDSRYKPFTGLNLNSSHLGLLGADHDGDKVSLTIVMKEESIEEINNLLKSKKYYVNNDGKLYFSGSEPPIDTIVRSFTS